MTHPLVNQLKFAREKWLTGYEGLSAEDAIKRQGDANCPSWMVGHLACFEQLTWCELAQGRLVTEVVKICDFGLPATTPPLDEMLAAWQQIIPICNVYLDTLTDADMMTRLTWPNGKPFWDDIGTTILRHTWHYWYHLGEMQALRSALGHKNLGPYIGKITAGGKYQAV